MVGQKRLPSLVTKAAILLVDVTGGRRCRLPQPVSPFHASVSSLCTMIENARENKDSVCRR